MGALEIAQPISRRVSGGYGRSQLGDHTVHPVGLAASE